MWGFIKAYVKSMRLYYAFITGIAGWLGIAFYEYLAVGNETIMEVPSYSKKFVILTLLFLSWGINQIINDFLGLKEDRINAPERPMVTGELNAKKAVMVSGLLLLLSLAVISIYLEPVAIIPAIAGVLLNILYEYAKGYGVFGNVVFGIMIAMSTAVGFLASGPLDAPYITKDFCIIFGLVAVLNGTMTFYTYFKDYVGDKSAGKKTLVVKYGLNTSRKIAILLAFIPALSIMGIFLSGNTEIEMNATFAFLALITFFLQLWTGYLYYRYPQGDKTYYSLAVNFRACACGQAALIAFFDAGLALKLFILTYVFIGFLFDLHANSRT